MKNVLILIHGVMTKEDNWTDEFGKRFRDDPNFSDWEIVQIEYGYLFFLWCIFPYVINKKSREVNSVISCLYDKYGSDCKVHVIAHSYGTKLIFNMLGKLDNRVQFGNIILVGGIVNEKEKFQMELKFNKVFNFCSYNDNVVWSQPVFGKCGYFGFVTDWKKEHKYRPYLDKNVWNYRFNIFGHSDYFNGSVLDFFILWRQLLRR